MVIVNYRLSTVNCQLSTVNCQLSTINCHMLDSYCQPNTAAEQNATSLQTLSRTLKLSQGDFSLIL
ncbi:MAG: tocopherol cyclase, partial [Oscillatoriales cyanobacterium RU_3_3]|nr:tocopherol cyclase [Oscillatoriales cyanobacterium RU_3_3]